MTELLEEIRAWCRGRWWLPRMMILIWFVRILFSHLEDPEYQSFFKGLDLGIHELGHVLTRPFGDLICVASGSFLQCFVPVIGMVMFVRQRDFFAISFAFGWLSANLFDVAVYAGDARAMKLPLVSVGGGEAYHDWNFLLDYFGMLNWDAHVACVIRLAAIVSMVIALTSGSWLCWLMIRSSRERSL